MDLQLILVVVIRETQRLTVILRNCLESIMARIRIITILFKRYPGKGVYKGDGWHWYARYVEEEAMKASPSSEPFPQKIARIFVATQFPHLNRIEQRKLYIWIERKMVWGSWKGFGYKMKLSEKLPLACPCENEQQGDVYFYRFYPKKAGKGEFEEALDYLIKRLR